MGKSRFQPKSSAIQNLGEVVVAQFVEWLLLNTEVRGSNPVIGKNLYGTFVTCLLSTESKRRK